MTIPGPFDPGTADVEAKLRAALHTEAASITPGDRLAEIESRIRMPSHPTPVAGVHREGRTSRPRYGRVGLLAAAASLALVAGGAWWAVDSRPGDPGNQPGPAGRPAASSLSSDTAPAPSPSASGAPAGAIALPFYYLGVDGLALAEGQAPRPRIRLLRTFAAADGGSRTERVAAAIRLALAHNEVQDTSDGAAPWRHTDLVDATVSDALITLTLSDGGESAAVSAGPAAPTAEHARLAVQQLVWTAQAAAGARIPVTFVLADGATSLLGQFPAADRYDRPDTGRIGDEVARIWVDSPELDADLAPGAPIGLRGTALLPAAQLGWTLDNAAGPVTEGEPVAGGVQHTYAATLTAPAAPGGYRLCVSATSDAELDRASTCIRLRVG